jgi:predicted negative regulator of RcsB-dependent stress response
MATASGRISRKDLRQPDWFQTNTERAVGYLSAHRAAVFAALAAVAVIVAIVIGWRMFKENQNQQASQEFGRAMSLYQGEKYREAIPVLESVATYRWSHYAVLAHIYLANSYLATNDLDKALSAGQRALAATRPNSFYRQIALVTLATAEEQKKDCQNAVQHYAEAQKITGALQGRAMLGKARCSETLGDNAAAVSAYKEYLKDNPTSPLAIKLAELESKHTPPASPASE